MLSASGLGCEVPSRTEAEEHPFNLYHDEILRFYQLPTGSTEGKRVNNRETLAEIGSAGKYARLSARNKSFPP